jgi:hypothetical protein
MDRNELPLDPRHIGVTSSASKIIFEPMVHSKPCTYFMSRLILSQNIPKLASTWPMPCRSTIGWVQNDFQAYGRLGANRAPILHQHLHYLLMDQHELSLNPFPLGVPSVAPKMIFEPIARSMQTLYCVKINTIFKWTESSFNSMKVLCLVLVISDNA